ncbi:MAG TPA: universal stress protein [Polyangiaceae bacterium]|jgi:nucleotide-binding universal stress UspA family protein|nr:universal stress protein [Polyangiaceae bacterium]
MNTLPMRPYFIALAALDFSALGDRALEEAARLHDSYPDMALHVVIVGRAENELIRMPCVDMGALPQADAEDFACRHVGELIAALQERGSALRLEHVMVYVLTGDPAKVIVELATSIDADRIVLGTHAGDGLKSWILGSVAEGVARNATCGVHIIRPRDFFEGEPLPAIQAPLQPGQHALIQFKERSKYHYVGRNAAAASRMMPAI